MENKIKGRPTQEGEKKKKTSLTYKWHLLIFWERPC